MSWLFLCLSNGNFRQYNRTRGKSQTTSAFIRHMVRVVIQQPCHVWQNKLKPNSSMQTCRAHYSFIDSWIAFSTEHPKWFGNWAIVVSHTIWRWTKVQIAHDLPYRRLCRRFSPMHIGNYCVWQPDKIIEAIKHLHQSFSGYRVSETFLLFCFQKKLTLISSLISSVALYSMLRWEWKQLARWESAWQIVWNGKWNEICFVIIITIILKIIIMWISWGNGLSLQLNWKFGFMICLEYSLMNFVNLLGRFSDEKKGKTCFCVLVLT